MATMNISLPDLMREWVESRIEEGTYSNVSDYIRDLIRRDQDLQNKQEMLFKALEAGKNSGISKKTIEEIWQEVKSRNG